mgnify:CR=1 FL=1
MWLALWLSCANKSTNQGVEPVKLVQKEQQFWQGNPHWSGEVVLPNDQVLGHTVHFTVVDGQLTANMDIPMQNAKGMPLSDLIVTADEMSFTLKPPKTPKIAWAYYHFERVSDSEWNGTLNQMKQTFPADLKVGVAEALHRPQTPIRPFPYSTKEVVVPLKEEGTILAGTLVLPNAGLNKPENGWPSVVFITGSGSQDRDETIFEHKPFAVIADHLAKIGIASIRVDDRGVGNSTGVREDLTTLDFASDIAQVKTFMGAQTEIDASKVGLIGHSEGGLIAGIVASDQEVAFVVSLAGTGVNGLEVLIEQNLDMLAVSDSEVRDQFRLDYTMAVQSDLDSIEESQGVKGVLSVQLSQSKNELTKETTQATLRQFQELKANDWFQTFLRLEPSEYWSKVRAPVLILNGEKDLQVADDINTQAIQRALPEDTESTIEIVLGANHLFQQAETGQISEYGSIEQTIDPTVLMLISDWIVQQSE